MAADINESDSHVPIIASESNSESKYYKLCRVTFIVLVIRDSLIPQYILYKRSTLADKPYLAFAYAAFVSVGWFLIWGERAYRTQERGQSSRCTNANCPLLRFKKEQPKNFTYTFWLIFFLAYAVLTIFIWIVQLFFRKDNVPKISSRLIILDIIILSFNVVIAHSFNVYFSHNATVEIHDDSFIV